MSRVEKKAGKGEKEGLHGADVPALLQYLIKRDQDRLEEEEERRRKEEQRRKEEEQRRREEEDCRGSPSPQADCNLFATDFLIGHVNHGGNSWELLF